MPQLSSSPERTAAADVIKALRAADHQAYLVGGCVRDLLLGRSPSDFDVATSAHPQEVLSLFPKTYAVGVQFGVVLVCLEIDGHETQTEVATFRNDGIYSDGRHPDAVSFSSTPREDVLRRDFTINGLLLDPFAEGSPEGSVLDFVGGRSDLEAGIIRTIGSPEQRFSEDKLRMLRAVRFAARFGYTIEAGTMQAIRRLARQIHQVSHERIRDEIVKMMTEGRARRAFELLDETGLLAEVLPEVAATKGVQQPPQYHPEGDVWVHTLLLLEKLQPDCPVTLALGALLHDVGKPPTFRAAEDRIRFDGHAEVGTRMAEEVCNRLRFSNEDREQIALLVANHMRFADVKKMRQSTLKRFMRLPRFQEHMELHRIDCLSSHGDLELYDFVRQMLEKIPVEEIRPKPLVSGDDLIAAGYKPGPEFKVMLEAAEDAQLEGQIHSTEEGVALVRRLFSTAQKD